MSVELMVKGQWKDAWTDLTVAGEHEEEVASVIASRLIACEFEVLVEEEDGEMVPFEESDRG